MPLLARAQANYEAITIDSDLDGAVDIDVVDFDGDGDLDVVACGYVGSVLVWYENENFSSFTRHTIASEQTDIYSLTVADFNGDGKPDVAGAVYGLDQVTVWFQGDGFAFTESILGAINGPHTVEAFDADGDGDDDIAAAGSSSKPIKLFTNDGNGAFTSTDLTTESYQAQSCMPMDIDGDGDLDLLSNNYSESWFYKFKNDGSGNFTRSNLCSSDGAHWITAGDVNGDDVLDLVTCSYRSSDLQWWEKSGSSYIAHRIDLLLPGAVYCDLGDLDGDDDLDIVATAEDGNDIAWYENDGTGSFIKHLMNGNYGSAANVMVVDFDGDGDLDVISAAHKADDVTWWRFSSPNAPTSFALHDPSSADTLVIGDGFDVLWSSSADPDTGADLRYLVYLSADTPERMIRGLVAETTDTTVTVLPDALWQFSGSGTYPGMLTVYAESQGDTVQCSNPAQLMVVQQTVGVEGNTAAIPESAILVRCWPNPFNRTLTVEVNLASGGLTRLELFDLLGRPVAQLGEAQLPPGRHQFAWEGELASGTYLLRVQYGKMQPVARRITYLK